MTTYRVTCYSPPAALKVKEGDNLEIVGFIKGNNIRATRVKNLSEKGASCICSRPSYEAARLATKEIRGTAGNVSIDKSFIEFDLTTE